MDSSLIRNLEFLENVYISTITTPKEIEDKFVVEEGYALIAETNLPTPKKFLEDGLAEEITAELKRQGAHPEKIWLLPFECGELDESRNTVIIISVSPNNVDKNADDAIRIHRIVRNLLRHQMVGRPNTFVTWSYILDNYQNPIVPKYKPPWEK